MTTLNGDHRKRETLHLKVGTMWVATMRIHETTGGKSGGRNGNTSLFNGLFSKT